MSCIIRNLSSICRFCHSDGNFRTFTLPNYHNGKIESYGDILQKTFNISMIMPEGVNASNMICDDCILSLTDAAKFKDQVLACENKFQQYVKNEFFATESDVKDYFAQVIKIEDDDVDYSSNTKDEVKDKTTYFEEIKNSATLENEDQKKVMNMNSVGKKIRKVKNKNIITSDIITCCVCLINLSRIELSKHLKTHKGPYMCKYCGKKFHKYATLFHHTQKEHKQKDINNLYTCNFCQQSCKTEKSLFSHLDKHTRQKVFDCDICHSRLKYKSKMVKHIATHDPDRLDKIHECPQCSWRFAEKTNLINHIKAVHERIRNYQCTICPKTFAAKKNLKLHLRSHTNEHPYKCNICHKGYKIKTALYRHKKKVHLNVAKI